MNKCFRVIIGTIALVFLFKSLGLCMVYLISTNPIFPQGPIISSLVIGGLLGMYAQREGGS